MAKNTFGVLSIEQIIVQMIQAVEDLHDLGFVHTEIKPEIFRIKNNRVFIIDLEHSREFIVQNHLKL
jgi:serine/threonine protein kinase